MPRVGRARRTGSILLKLRFARTRHHDSFPLLTNSQLFFQRLPYRYLNASDSRRCQKRINPQLGVGLKSSKTQKHRFATGMCIPHLLVPFGRYKIHAFLRRKMIVRLVLSNQLTLLDSSRMRIRVDQWNDGFLGRYHWYPKEPY
jgi:hypothetical protein